MNSSQCSQSGMSTVGSRVGLQTVGQLYRDESGPEQRLCKSRRISAKTRISVLQLALSGNHGKMPAVRFQLSYINYILLPLFGVYVPSPSKDIRMGFKPMGTLFTVNGQI